MASYTMELRKVCDYYGREEVESWFKHYQLSDFLTTSQIETINSRGFWSKDKLAKQIVDHFYMREIGQETPALFKHFVISRMNEIMETALPIIYSSSIDFDPLENVNFTETLKRNITGNLQNTGNSNSTSNNSASGLNVSSDTPQGEINKQNILNGTYATQTNASETSSNIQDETNTTSNSSNNQNEEYTKNIKGNNGATITNQRLIEQYRNIIISINKDIIEKLNPLFFGLF